MTLRAVVDPNVFISAQISSLGHPARIAQAADKGIFELVVSERLLSELHDVLMRPRFRHHTTESEVENLVEALRENSIVAEEGEIGRMVPDDPKDDYLVARPASREPTTSSLVTRTLPQLHSIPRPSQC